MANVIPNRIKVVQLINEAAEKGETITREELCEKLDISKASLASVFTQLRLTGRYPMTRSDKSVYLGTEEEWKEYNENRAANSTEVSPEKRRKTLQTTIDRAKTTMEKLAEAAAAKDEEAVLRYNLAQAKAQLATWELSQLPEEEAAE